MRITYTKNKTTTKSSKNNNKIIICISGLETKRLRYNLPFYIKDTDWLNGFPKQTPELIGLRDSLNGLKNDLTKWYQKQLEAKKPVSNDDVILEIRYWTGEVKRNLGLFEALDKCYSSKKVSASKSRSDSFLQLKGRLKAYNKNLTFAQINNKKFHEVLVNNILSYQYNRKKLPAQKTTINTSIEVFNHFMKYSFGMGYLIDAPIMVKKLEVKEQNIIALEKEEVVILENATFNLHSIKGKRFDIIRDLFLMSCYTGLRYSDVMFNGSDANGNMVDITIKKTNDIFTLHLIPEAIDILKKYNWKLPFVGKTHYNVQLKVMFKELGLNRPVKQFIQLIGKKVEVEDMPLYDYIRTHTGRKTFITNCLRSGISPMQTMKLSNHKNFDSFMKYIEFADKELGEEIRKISKKSPLVVPPSYQHKGFTPLTDDEIAALPRPKMSELEKLEEELRILELKAKIKKLKGGDGEDDKSNLKVV